jgi:orotate phosphoribosyltransferase-like protein
MQTISGSKIRKKYSYHCSSYIKEVIDKNDRGKTVAKALEALRTKSFDAIICTGISGITAGSILAYELKKELIILRKNSRNSHSQFEIEGLRQTPINQPSKEIKSIIVDDLICSGETMQRIFEKIKQEKNGKNVRIIGGYFYNDCYGDGELGSFFNLKKIRDRVRVDFSGF